MSVGLNKKPAPETRVVARMLMTADGAGLEARTVDGRTPPPIAKARLSNVLSGVALPLMIYTPVLDNVYSIADGQPARNTNSNYNCVRTEGFRSELPNCLFGRREYVMS